MSALQFLGTGWAFPVTPDGKGQLPLSDGRDQVNQAIGLILETEPGERVMRPDFGCGLRRYLMKPNTVATRTLLRDDVTQALVRWEPRISVKEVSVEPGDDPAMVVITISYLLTRSGQSGNFVYPFYLMTP
ncbi:MAG: GPW/gp25 family protein [Myxococcaceae bacterium]